jgi:O-6-methylguanine DNA methyltransferase
MTQVVPSPLGPLIVAWNETGMFALEFADHESRMIRFFEKNDLATRKADAADRNPYTPTLERYFAGETAALEALPVVLVGTAFQIRVWNALREIPVGTTSTYGERAAAIGQPGAARAVGAANGQNPIGIVVPCHRVIGASGSLSGYAGGVERKKWLLNHERAK